jgi:hypothetical protein
MIIYIYIYIITKLKEHAHAICHRTCACIAHLNKTKQIKKIQTNSKKRQREKKSKAKERHWQRKHDLLQLLLSTNTIIETGCVLRIRFIAIVYLGIPSTFKNGGFGVRIRLSD